MLNALQLQLQEYGTINFYDIKKQKPIMIIYGIKWKCEGYFQATGTETA
jgi:hypothetical protein